jgi:hypothetical protein
MRLLDSFSTSSRKSCVTKQRVGINTLKSMLPDLADKSGIGVHYTNHSLRATTITRMFNSGLPEKIIAETSGHRSMKALRCYERTCETQRQAVTTSINLPDTPQNLLENSEPTAARGGTTGLRLRAIECAMECSFARKRCFDVHGL